MNFFHTEQYLSTIDLSKRAASRSRGVCFGVGRFMARSIRHRAEAAHTLTGLFQKRPLTGQPKRQKRP